MANEKKNTATTTETLAETPKNVALAGIGNAGQYDFSDWEKEQIGFAPYWTPEEGHFFVGVVTKRDDAAQDFVRYMVEARTDTACKRGTENKDTLEDVVVKAGETFTISVYWQLRALFDEYLESGVSPVIRCKALREVPTSKKGQTCWQFEVMTSPADRVKMNKVRAQFQMQAAAERRAIAGAAPSAE